MNDRTEMEVGHIEINESDFDPTSLVSLFDFIAEEMKKHGDSDEFILSIRQNFFIGADAYHRAMVIAAENDDVHIMEKLGKEIAENLGPGLRHKN